MSLESRIALTWEESKQKKKKKKEAVVTGRGLFPPLTSLTSYLVCRTWAEHLSVQIIVCNWFYVLILFQG